jgi:hypothetical protein
MIQTLLTQIDAVCFGMGLGRDDGQSRFIRMVQFTQSKFTFRSGIGCRWIWFLAKASAKIKYLMFMQPHIQVKQQLYWVVKQRILSKIVLQQFISQQKYAGQWVLKGR